MGTGVPRILLETSEALAFLNDEPGSGAVNRLLDRADDGQIHISMARAGWEEIQDRNDAGSRGRTERLFRIVGHVGNVAQLGSWQLGSDVLGSDQSRDIDRGMPSGASQADRDQMLVHEAVGFDFLVARDKHFTQRLTRERIAIPLGLRIGDASLALRFLAEGGIEFTS